MSEMPEMSDFPELRATLAAVPLLEPPPDLVRRWHAALDQLPPPSPAVSHTDTASDVETAGARPPITEDHGEATRQTAATHENTASADRPSVWAVGMRRLARRRPVLGAAVLASAAACAALVALPGLVGVFVAPAPPGPERPNHGRPSEVVPGLKPPPPPDPLGGVPGRVAGCLAHVGAPGATVVGIRPSEHDGRPAVLLVLATPMPGRFRSLLVTPDCGPDAGAVLQDRLIGR